MVKENNYSKIEKEMHSNISFSAIISFFIISVNENNQIQLLFLVNSAESSKQYQNISTKTRSESYVEVATQQLWVILRNGLI